MTNESLEQMLSVQVLRAAGASNADAQQWLPYLLQTCEIYEINTPARLAAFLAQLGHESGGLRYTVEIWGPTAAQKTYEGRVSLGNTQPGDGERFKGHGLIQITGRFNHVAVRDGLRERLLDPPDFEQDPDALASAPWAALSAGWYWHSRKLNALADSGDFEGITRKINGGMNGHPDRVRRLEDVRKAIASTSAAGPPPTQTAPANPAPSRPVPPEENAMPLPIAAPLLISLAGNLIDAFAPLAREKVTKELARHTESPQVAEQVAASVMDVAARLTGKDDPIDAVAAVKANPDMLDQVQAQALAELEKLTPMLEKLAAYEARAWAAEETSRNDAAARAKGDEVDITLPLMRAGLNIFAAMIFFVGLLCIVQLLKTGEVRTEIMTLLSGLVATMTTIVISMYAYRFGTSRSSGAKDVIIDKLSTRQKP